MPSDNKKDMAKKLLKLVEASRPKRAISKPLLKNDKSKSKDEAPRKLKLVRKK